MTTVDKRARLIDTQEVQRAFSILSDPGQVVEIRALDASTQAGSRYAETLSGYFDNTKSLLKHLPSIQSAKGIYLTLQVCDPELLNRAENKIKRVGKNSTTSDINIQRYRWLLIDCDPDRGITKVSDISSTDEEHEKALEHSQHIKSCLREIGWPEPVRADSGNGAHLLYRIDLPASDRDLVQHTLEGLSQKYSIPGINIDQTVFNPARICKLYGTLVCKGDNTTRRPHRMSRLLEVPTDFRIVSREQLEAMATPTVIVESTLAQAPLNPISEKFTAEAFIQKHSIDTYGPEAYNGGTRWILKSCVWNGDHTDRSACIFQFADGRLGASCSHASCHGKGWKDLRLIFEPKAYDRNLTIVKTKNTEDKDDQAGEPEKKLTKEEITVFQLMEFLQDVHYIKTPSGALYARVKVKDHHEIVSVNEKGSGLRRWLVHKYKQGYGVAPGSEAQTRVMAGALSDAEYYGEEAKVHSRFASHKGKVYLDLANNKWECIEISSKGWQIISCPPVYFRRPNGMLPLPKPEPGGSLDELRELINAKEDKDRHLITAWLVGTLHPTGPYPVLNLNGERGSAKSKATTILRNLVDPNEAPTRTTPKDDREAAIAAQNNMVIALDNLSKMPMWLSDLLCRIATGAGYTTRENYTDDREVVFNARRPIVLNGIEDGLITAGDLLSRTMLVSLCPPEQYMTEEDIDELFEEKHPRLLGALLDAAVVALRDRKSVHLDDLPRMADFARWIIAAEPALGWEPGSFMNVFTENQDDATTIVMDSSPIAKAISQLMNNYPGLEWMGTAQTLYDELSKYDIFTKPRPAAANAQKLSGQLKRVAPTLRVQGLDIQQKRTGGARQISIKRTTETPDPTKKYMDSDATSDASDATEKHASSLRHTDKPTPQAGLAAISDASDASDDKILSLSPSLPSSSFEEREKEKGDKSEKVASLASLSSPVEYQPASQANLEHDATSDATVTQPQTDDIVASLETDITLTPLEKKMEECLNLAIEKDYPRFPLGKNGIEGEESWLSVIYSAHEKLLDQMIKFLKNK